jgi:CheY-like chemotaxis protein
MSYGTIKRNTTVWSAFTPGEFCLKNDPQTWGIPIIGMSAHAVESEREKAIATGCDEFDAKPIEFESLVATIRRVLAHHK